MNKRHCCKVKVTPVKSNKNYSHCPSIREFAPSESVISDITLFSPISPAVINCQTKLYRKITDYNVDVGYSTDKNYPAR